MQVLIHMVSHGWLRVGIWPLRLTLLRMKRSTEMQLYNILDSDFADPESRYEQLQENASSQTWMEERVVPVNKLGNNKI